MSKLAYVLFLIPIPAFSESKVSNLNFSEVITNCDQMNHSQWIKRYSDIESRVIEAIEKTPKISRGNNEELFEVVFPQDLPPEHGLKGAFLGCFEIFHEYQKAINNAQSLSARKRLETCYQDAYKSDPPSVLNQYMECLKKIKY